MENEVVKQTKTTKALAKPSANDYGIDFGAEDMIIPKVHLMQYTSEKVKAKEADFGEFRDSMNNELLGDTNNPMAFVPFYVKKKWLVKEKNAKGKFLYKETLEHTGQHLPFETPDGLIRNFLSYDVYLLREDDVKAGADFPKIVLFTSTSSKAGKKILTQFMINVKGGKPPWAKTFELVAQTATSEDGDYGVMDVRATSDTNKAMSEACKKWLDLVRSGAAKPTEEEVPF